MSHIVIDCRDYEMQLADGQVEKGGRVLLHGSQPVAYGALPWENVAFIGCHDNETVFDKVRGLHCVPGRMVCQPCSVTQVSMVEQASYV